MKKIIKLGLVSLLAVMVASCSSNSNIEEVKDCPQVCPMSQMGPGPKMDKKQCKEYFRKCKENFDKWAKFDSLSEQEQKELIQETKKAIDKREAKRKAFKDSIDALWKDFDNLSIDQQKSLLKHKMHGFHKPGFGKPGFHKHGHHKDGFHKGPKHCKKDFKKGDCKKGPRPHGPRPERQNAETPNK